MAWEPLLAGAPADAALSSLREIAGILEGKIPEASGFSYAYGLAGPGLFFGYLAKALGEDRFADAAEDSLARAADNLEDEPSTLGLFLGLAGLAWARHHLDELLTGEASAESTEEVDEVILETVRSTPWRGDYDLVAGLAGLGCYALDHPERGFAHEVMDQVVRRLEETALERDGGLTWWTSPALMIRETAELYPHGYFNLGVAHGVPGVIGLLARACGQGLGGDQAWRLLQGAAAWLLASRRPEDGRSSFTSYFSGIDGDGPGATVCQSGWCYGDAGVAAVLLSAARWAGEGSWERAALEVAFKDCARPASAEAIGTTLCHGAPGLGHIYNRMYQATGEEAFAVAARGWLQAAVTAHAPGAGTWGTAWGLLEGMTGAGLALLSALFPLEPGWDRPFLLDIPVPERR